MEKLWYTKDSEIPFSHLDEIISGTSHLLIHVWAGWNGVDGIQIEELKKWGVVFEDHMTIRSINVDQKEFREILRSWKISNVPALVFFRDGKHMKTVSHLLREDDLLKAVNEIYGAPEDDV